MDWPNGAKRIPVLPDVPTLVDVGVKFDAVGWHGAFLPASVPPSVVNRLNAAFTKAVSQPDIRSRIVNGGSIPVEPPLTAEKWTDRYRREIRQWAEAVRAAGLQAQ